MRMPLRQLECLGQFAAEEEAEVTHSCEAHEAQEESQQEPGRASPHYSDTDSSSSSSSSDDEPEVDPAVEAERLRYVLYTCCHHAQPLIPLLTPSADVIKARIRELAASVGSLHGV